MLPKVLYPILIILFLLTGGKASGVSHPVNNNGTSTTYESNGPDPYFASVGTNFIKVTLNTPPSGFAQLPGSVYILWPDGFKYLFPLKFVSVDNNIAHYTTTYLADTAKFIPGKYSVTGTLDGKKIIGPDHFFWPADCVVDPTAPAPTVLPTRPPYPGPLPTPYPGP